MNFSGSTINFPFRSDVRGTFVTTSNRDDIIAQAIADVLNTRKGERVCLPDYGIRDFIFAVQNASFAHRLAFELDEQIKNYVPLVRDTKIKVTTIDAGKAEVSIRYQELGSIQAPKNLVFPVWRYQETAQ